MAELSLAHGIYFSCEREKQDAVRRKASACCLNGECRVDDFTSSCTRTRMKGKVDFEKRHQTESYNT